MLNAFWAAVVPAIDEAGGVIEHFAGDRIMAIFNTEGDQPDVTRGVPLAPRGRCRGRPTDRRQSGRLAHVPCGHQHGARGAR